MPAAAPSLDFGLLAGQQISIGIQALCLLLSLAAMGLLYLARVRHHASRAQERTIDALSERERAAHQLNDNLMQTFQALIFRFHLAVDQVERNDPSRHMLEEVLLNSDQILAESRERVIDLQSPDSGVDDLSTALIAVGEALQKSAPAQFRVIIDGKIRELQPLLRDEVYRIGREALTNSFRHAKASQIETEISYQRNELRLRFRDNGIGIAPGRIHNGLQAKSEPHRWGMTGMQSRALRIGAQFEIWTRQNAGTEIELRIPSRLAYAIN
jgi:signal transduction histidine kinase